MASSAMPGYRFRSASSRSRVARRPAMSARAAIRPRSVSRPSLSRARRRRRRGSRKLSSPKLGMPVSRQAASRSRRSSSDTSSTPARSSPSPTRFRARSPVRSNADVTSMLSRAPCRLHVLASRSRCPAPLPHYRAAGAPRAEGRAATSRRGQRRVDRRYRSAAMVKLSKTVQPCPSNCLCARGDIWPESQAVRWGALRSSRCAKRAMRWVHAT